MRLVEIAAVVGVFFASAGVGYWLPPRPGNSGVFTPVAPVRTAQAQASDGASLAGEIERVLAEPKAVRRSEALLFLVPRLSRAELAEVVAQLLRLQRGPAGWEGVEAALLRLVELDAAQAVQLAAAAPDERIRERAIQVIFLTRSADEVSGLLRLLGPKLQDVATTARALRDPEAALARAAKKPEDIGLVGGAFEDLARRGGGPAAMQRAEAIPPGRVRIQALRGAIAGWAKVDPAGALAWIAAHPEARKDGIHFAGLIPAIAVQPVAAAQFALAQSNGPERADALQSVARGWWRQDPTRALAWVQSLPVRRDQRAAALGLISDWAALDPASAQALATSLEGVERDGESLIYQVASSWAERDLPTAQNWLNGLPPAFRSQALNGSVSGALATADDPRRLLAWLSTLSLGPGESGVVAQVVRRQTELDFDAALAWSLAVHDRTLASPLLADLASRQARTDFSKAIGMLDDWFARSADRPGRVDSSLIVAIEKLAARWANQDPAAAARWAAGLPADARHGATGAAIASAWAARDATAAVAWYGAPNAPMQADALRAIFLGITPQDPNAALALAARLPPGDLRRIALRAIRGEWLRIDPNAVAAWLVRDKPDLARPSMPFQLRIGGASDND